MLARVEATDPDLVRLHVKETWKRTAAKQVEVIGDSEFGCPAPPRFHVGRDVIAFLSHDEDGRFHVSHGTRYFNDARELTALRDLVKSTMQSKVATPSFEWIEQAFKEPVTRWDGMISASLDDGHTLSPRFATALKQAFIQKPSRDDSVIQIMRVLRDDRSPELTRAFAKSIDALFVSSQEEWLRLEAVELFEFRVKTPTETPDDVRVRWVKLKKSLGLR